MIMGYEHTNRVSMGKNFKPDEDVKVTSQIKAILDVLLVDKPLWEFQLNSPDYNNTAHAIRLTQDGEELGTVHWRWTLGSMKYYIYNERIADKMQRARGYSTKDPKKAITKIKQMFGQRSIAEKSLKAMEEAQTCMNQASTRKSSEHRQTQHAVESAALRYVVYGPAWDAFVKYAEANDTTVFNTIRKREELKDELDEIKKVNHAFINNKALLVVRDNSVYIVKSYNSDQPTVMTDDMLPFHVRGKLGMLKLVEKEHYIAGMGFRADDDTFIVMNEENEDEGIQK